MTEVDAGIQDTQPAGGPFRSAGAVLVGLLAIIVLSIGTDAILHMARLLPPAGQPTSNKMLVVALIYRTIYSAAGCYLAALLAPRRPMLYALALGFIGLLVSIAGTVATWNGGPEFGAKWYPIALIILSLPSAWVGGRIRERQLASRPRIQASSN